jgi:hypothetical protein
VGRPDSLTSCHVPTQPKLAAMLRCVLPQQLSRALDQLAVSRHLRYDRANAPLIGEIAADPGAADEAARTDRCWVGAASAVWRPETRGG